MSSKVLAVIEGVELVAFVAFIIWKPEWFMFCLILISGLAFIGFGVMFILRAISPSTKDIVTYGLCMSRISSLLWGFLCISGGIAMPLQFLGGEFGRIGKNVLWVLRKFDELRIASIQIIFSLCFWIPVILVIYGFAKGFWRKITKDK